MWQKVKDWVAAQGAQTANIEELRMALLRRAEGCCFLDVREKGEWDAGHISGFLHIPIGELERRIGELGKSTTVYVLCHSGGRSALACAILARHGHGGARNVLGGIEEWIARGYPIER